MESRVLSGMNQILVGGLLGHRDDLKTGAVAPGVRRDGSRVARTAGDDATVRLVGTLYSCAREFCPVKITDFLDGVAALKIGGYGVNAPEGHRSRSLLLYLG